MKIITCVFLLFILIGCCNNIKKNDSSLLIESDKYITIINKVSINKEYFKSLKVIEISDNRNSMKFGLKLKWGNFVLYHMSFSKEKCWQDQVALSIDNSWINNENLYFWLEIPEGNEYDLLKQIVDLNEKLSGVRCEEQ